MATEETQGDAPRLSPEDARAIARIIWRNQQRRAAHQAAATTSEDGGPDAA
jgi:hypothetical protein